MKENEIIELCRGLGIEFVNRSYGKITTATISLNTLVKLVNKVITKKLFLVFRNADMTEGRGPMVLNRIFDNEESANIYANSQDGIMGRKSRGDWKTKGGGDWEVQTWDIQKEIPVNKSRITIQMPKEAAEKLIASYKADPEGVKKYFADFGFNILDILPAITDANQSA